MWQQEPSLFAALRDESDVVRGLLSLVAAGDLDVRVEDSNSAAGSGDFVPEGRDGGRGRVGEGDELVASGLEVRDLKDCQLELVVDGGGGEGTEPIQISTAAEAGGAVQKERTRARGLME